MIYLASLSQDIHCPARHEAALSEGAPDPRHQVGVDEEDVGPSEPALAVQLPVQEPLGQSLRT